MNCIIAGVCLQSCVGGVCSALIAKEEHLNELDRGSGDGDCGSTLKAGVAGKERERQNSSGMTFSISSYPRESVLHRLG